MIKTAYLATIILLLLGCGSLNSKQETRNMFEYKVGWEYVYKYHFKDSSNIKLLFEFQQPIYSQGDNADKFAWRFVPYNNKNAIDVFTLKVHDFRTNGDQTAIEYSYYNEDRFICAEATGLIQNEKGIWFHPPRTKAFRITEINPFPSIKFGINKNDSWQDELLVGGQWGDKRWATWEGDINFETTYSNNGLKKISTEFGNLLCYEIVGVSNSELGNTRTTSYYNDQYGFIKIVYFNIDKTSLVLDLIDVKKMVLN